MEKWAETFNLPLPSCNKCGSCCICATPSVSYKELLEKAAKGEEFARDFYSIFIPYQNITDAEKICADTVKNTLESSNKGKNNINKNELVFYKCKYYSDSKKCLIYEDRPELCRDFPGSPFVLLNKKCAYFVWAKECKIKYKEFQNEIENLKKYKEEIQALKYQQKSIELLKALKTLKKINNDEYKFALTLPSSSLISPGSSWIKGLFRPKRVNFIDESSIVYLYQNAPRKACLFRGAV